MQNVAAVTRDLEGRLTAGEWNVDDQFDTFDQLMERYPALTNIYRVRAALAPLIHAGLLESRQGSGTWVLRVPEPPAVSRSSQAMSAFLDELLSDIDAVRAKVAAYRLQFGEEPADVGVSVMP
jgi:DNA-binding GntR family transcriptional regulator